MPSSSAKAASKKSLFRFAANFTATTKSCGFRLICFSTTIAYFLFS